MLGPATSWAAPEWNPTDSDTSSNTAGGAGVLPGHLVGGSHHNTGFGKEALAGSIGDYNTATGFQAMYSIFGGGSNAAYGSSALFSNTTGDYNTATGAGAMNKNVDGHFNAAHGFYALSNNTGADYNTAAGAYALYSNTTGQYNLGEGFQALYSNTTGVNLTATGANALFANTTGHNNTANGYNSLQNNTTGYYNVGEGSSTMKFNTTGYQNTALGRAALLNNTTGHDNVAIGHLAGNNLAAGHYNVYIASPGGNPNESNTIRIGSADHARFFVAGVGIGLSGSTVIMSSEGQLGIVASSARYKKDIHDMDDQSAKLQQLRPVTFHYTAEPAAQQYGLIAEEVAAIYPELVVRGKEGQVESVQYHQLTPILLAQVKKQQQEIAALREENERVRAAAQVQATDVQARLTKLEAQLDLLTSVASR